MGVLREIALQASVLLITLGSFWVYYDGLERLPNLEANLWAVVVLFAGGWLLWTRSIGATAITLAVLLLYGVRTRSTRSSDIGSRR